MSESKAQFRALFEEHEPLMLFVLDIFKEEFPIRKLCIFCKVNYEKLHSVQQPIHTGEQAAEIL